jgi:hypothetical protein
MDQLRGGSIGGIDYATAPRLDASGNQTTQWTGDVQQTADGMAYEPNLIRRDSPIPFNTTDPIQKLAIKADTLAADPNTFAQKQKYIDKFAAVHNLTLPADSILDHKQMEALAGVTNISPALARKDTTLLNLSRGPYRQAMDMMGRFMGFYYKNPEWPA